MYASPCTACTMPRTALELLLCAAMSQAHTAYEPPGPAPLPQNRVIVNISEAVREALRQRLAIRAMYLPTAEWTRAPEGSGVVGRHPCAPADESGVHFDTGTANLAHIQQVRCGGVGVLPNVVAHSERCSIALRSLAAVDERICVVGLLNELQTRALIGHLLLGVYVCTPTVQVLHAVALQAVDRPGWHDTHWYRARYLSAKGS